MPNRIIKESICTSENIDQLSAFHETVFYRLMVNCDDYGRMDAREKILAARLFPLKTLKAGQITDAVKALVKADLVILYEVNGKPYVQMKTWNNHQQIRAKKSKFPSPDDNCNHLISDDIKCPRNPIQYEYESNTNTKENKPRFTPPTVEEVAEYCKSRGNGINAQHFVDYYTARGWELKPGQKVKDWQACVRTWERRDGMKATVKFVPAANFEQRDYSDVPGEMMTELAAEINEMKRGAG